MLKHGWIRSLFALVIFTIAQAQVLAATSAGVTYSGRLVGPSGTPVEGLVQFRLQIRTPNSSNCLLFQETKNVDLTGRNGYFTLTLNDTTTGVILSGSYPLDRVFANVGKFEVTHPNLDCGGTNEYTPNPTDGRKLKVFFKDIHLPDWEELPAMDINFVPTALESLQVGGFKAAHLLRVQDNSGVPQSVTAFTPTEFSNLLDLMDGTSNSYVRSSTTIGLPAPVVSGNPSSAAAGSVWFDSVTGRLKYHDGTAVQTLGTSGGSVSSVSAGTGLTTGGSPITAAGTIGIANGGVDTLQIKDGAVTSAKLNDSGVTAGVYGSGTKIPVITVDAQGRLTLVSEANITGVLPSGTNGEYLKSNGAAWASARIEIADIKSTGTGHPSFFNFSAACTLEKTLVYDSVNDRMNCTAIGINANQVTAGTLDKARLPVEAVVDGGNTVTAPLAIGTKGTQNLELLVNNSAQAVLDSNGRMGIGTTTPGVTLDIVSRTPSTAVGANRTGVSVSSEGTDVGSRYFARYAGTSRTPIFQGLSSGGTLAAPTVTADGRALVEFSGAGYDGTDWVTGSAISMRATQDWSAAGQGSDIRFITTGNGATSNSEKMRLDPSGNLGIGLTSPTAVLNIKAGGSLEGTSPLKFTTGALLTTPENGAVEYDGTDLYLTTAGVRRKLASSTTTGDYSGVGSITGSGALNISAGGSNQNLVLAGSGTGQVQSPSLFHVTNTTASTSKTNGALVVDGGIGVSGTVNANALSVTTAILSPVIYGSDAPSGTLTLQGTSNTPRGNVMINPDGGNVGIGAATPQTLLDVRGSASGPKLDLVQNSTGAGDLTGLRFAVTTATNARKAGIFFERNSAVDGRGTLHFANNNITAASNEVGVSDARMSILSNGNVGVGTVNPVGIFDVVVDGSSADAFVRSYRDNVNHAKIHGLANRGTMAAPTALQANDYALELLGRTYDTTNTNRNTLGRVIIGAEGGHTNTSTPGFVSFATTPATTVADVERMRITSTGLVGIGTQTPGAMLDIAQQNANVTNGPALQITDTTAPGAFIRLADGTNVASAYVPTLWGKAIGSNRVGLMLLGEPGTDTNGGANAGIQINARLDSAALVNAPLLTVFNYTDEKLRVTAGGKVGIGTNNPISQLHAENSANSGTVTDNSDILIKSVNRNATLSLDALSTATTSVIFSGSGTQLGRINYAPSNNSMQFQTNNVERMRIDTNGYVGVGTTAPSARLDVQAPDASTGFNGGSSSPATTIRAMASDAAAIGVGGSVGLGGYFNGSTQTLFAAVRGYKANGTASDGSGKLQLQTYKANIGWNVGLYMDQDGDVGLGTTSPTARLEVTGGNLKVVSTATCILGAAAGGVNCTSDARLKDNVKIIPDALAKVLQLRGVEFDWNQRSSGYGRHDIGVIAQEVEKVFPTLIYQDTSSGYKMVDYAGLVSPLIESTKEIYGMCKAQETQIKTLERKIASLQEATQRLSSENERVSKENSDLKKRLELIERKLGLSQD